MRDSNTQLTRFEQASSANWDNGEYLSFDEENLHHFEKLVKSFSELDEISKRAVIFPDSLALEPLFRVLLSPVVPFLYKRDISKIFLDFLFKRFISERTPTGYQDFPISRGNYNNPALPVKEHSAQLPLPAPLWVRYKDHAAPLPSVLYQYVH